MDINTCTLTGRLTRDSDLRYSTGGMAILDLSVAVNRRIKKNDQYSDETSFFDAIIFGKSAEALKSYTTKGKPVALTGNLRQERWQDKQGNNRSRVVIVVNNFQLLGGNRNGGNVSKYNGPSISNDGSAGYDAQNGDYGNMDEVPFDV